MSDKPNARYDLCIGTVHQLTQKESGSSLEPETIVVLGHDPLTRVAELERQVAEEKDRHAETDAYAKSWEAIALERGKERDEFKRIGQQFEADSRKHFEQACTNLARAEAAEKRAGELGTAVKKLRYVCDSCVMFSDVVRPDEMDERQDRNDLPKWAEEYLEELEYAAAALRICWGEIRANPIAKAAIEAAAGGGGGG